ncbi:MAG: bifunctional phosphoribosyl-AMP cyclohydrolase/phosphoribosyl-ATP pyrophosphatase [Sulfurimonas sp. RIFCSPHIGHO2_12_FULL_36_9]|uniref:bifunctional phosphoribosyl-AMP cyclohydrolase/phosphoribosyl-ATP diphosphatase HisIE n=1 Tax=Sulfurimonas sp. RIFCSPLOWO2_12_36_12 TaxID=1802253 RepID=UPI0008CA6657|nr:bifunctional phosphoribosyl-AMP cyclohydrolase/phosphoribosyl-ATP diphosphatase HisIE [Sulfurimonas sp. RIFCSPLOWO2_12_36_12]OHD96917.1 MAG: bifunctional phosphoribosyl-AMP cyclohydrolase/phosphoribosyl-ATP pyrophosphatase [Sulfurimonas sp. RIFCSPLOWO2_02_FULL_36_28]OHD99183.1 MAG: bifunctional phosphoribosyl-AMP cyclohydrolase/phosphoribosyl-ATP pyrophosphatase [Sulfurimonas sp. RIFCSPHIGHO2_12_FULL_36_9]OHE02153.1 MAG: bifunctional phosphoribosyl-AMP cyclohydrolase/phosphoribosyl-ATP pyroph
MQEIIDRIDWQKISLLPVIVQDSTSQEVLMMAYMNKEALSLSLTTKVAHYFSRSKQRIWKKGESSGHIQQIHSFNIDCDNDTLLIKVTQTGVACHTGRRSCFFTELESGEINSKVEVSSEALYGVIDTLYHTIQERKNADPSTSWTAKLLSKGENTILKKVVEEAGEFSFAYKDSDEHEIIYEAADLTYHVLVALAAKNISPDRVKQELARRFNMSGIIEKNSRED